MFNLALLYVQAVDEHLKALTVAHMKLTDDDWWVILCYVLDVDLSLHV